MSEKSGDEDKVKEKAYKVIFFRHYSRISLT